jgi:ABC-type transport system substrate-binding protein
MGPFRFVLLEPGRRLELERNPIYWRECYPRSEGLVFSLGLSPEEVLSGFREGRYSLSADLFPADVEAPRRDPQYASNYREVPSLITSYVAFNAHSGSLVERALRQRLVRAVPVKQLVRQTMRRLALPAHGFIPPGLLGYEPAAQPRAPDDARSRWPSRAGGGGADPRRQSSLLRTLRRALSGADRRPEPAGDRHEG